ncbi:transglycosylase domain-containing protein [Pontibacillus yanchengensis]|uniref:Penicillin-binding protein n=1 Tax=Pontibacillus yanchengensis Y32 TaxID=1385514 RepID=A0A0A2TI92_9BACI|nr:PBP1A family penicillin-binding protein [Pontibacillus yanchengensis]KGP74178.1 penicillin-binding protein [Pontibacillus yanchengensis Y32]
MDRILSTFKRTGPWKWITIGMVSVTGLGLSAIAGVLLYCYLLGAPPLKNQQNTIFYDDNAQVIGVEHGSENRYWIELDEMTPAFIQATIATEDRRFYEHFGFDFKRIAAAIYHDIQSMSKAQGASTITQQYARNLYLSHEKTWTRKIKEALYAVRLEMFYDKDEILEGYLNTIYYGHGAYGIEAASRYYFQKDAHELNLAESALLAAIPKGPSYYSPYTHMENAKRRQHLILENLQKTDYITEQQKVRALQASLELAPQEEQYQKQVAPYFQDVVMKEAEQLLQLDEESIRAGGYHVFTSLDTDLQKELETIVEETIPNSTDLQVGAMSMDPQTGDIVAMVGGRDYEESSYNRAVQAKRMPGSTFKPFLYYAALENGYTPATTLMSKPTYFELEDGNVYEPSNYNGYYAYEPITLAQAIALSDNVYAVKTNVFLGEETLVETAQRMGISGSLPAVPSLALGTASVSVQEMVGAYSLFANGGKEVTPQTIQRITDSHGHTVYERNEEAGEQIIDEDNAFVMAHLMTGMFDESLNDYMKVTGSSITDKLSRPFAGKSGTTQTDSWMIGFSPELTTGIWTGYDQNKPIDKVKEHQYAKDIWADFMENSHKDLPYDQFTPTDGVVGVYIDPDSGHLATPYCAHHRLAYFVEGTEPSSYCELHLPIDENGERQTPEEVDKKKNKGGLKNWLDIMF